MPAIIRKLFLSGSIIISASAIATLPALATTFTVAGNDYYLYEAYDSNDPDTLADKTRRIYDNNQINTILQGSCTVAAFTPSNRCPQGSPGGNLELFATSETLNFAQFLAQNQATSLIANFGDGTNMTLSSLTAQDWFGNAGTNYGANNFANFWFNQSLNTYGFTDAVISSFGYTKATLYDKFRNDGGFQRFSDPNIAYVNKKRNGTVDIGLIGHLNAANLLLPLLSPQKQTLLQLFLQNRPLQASEIVKVTYQGQSQYRYSFSAANSSLVAGDGTPGHDGLYKPKISFNVPSVTALSNTPAPSNTEPVPESSNLLGILAVGGLLAIRLKGKSKPD